MTAPGAYLRLAGVIAVFLSWDAAKNIAAFLDLVGWAEPALPPVNAYAPGILAAAVWLGVLAWRAPSHRIARGAGAAAVAVLGGVLLPLAGPTASGIGVLALAGAGGWLCLAVTEQAGIPSHRLGFRPRWAGNRRGRRQFLAVAMVAYAGHVLSNLIGGYLQLVPGPKPDDPANAHGVTDPFLLFSAAGAAGIREELPLIAMTVLLLTAAARPVWQMYAVAVTVRVLSHAYYGLLALSTVMFTLINIWLYRRTGRITPIIIGHIVYNLLILTIGQHYEFGLLLMSLLALPAVWMAEAPKKAKDKAETDG